MTDLKSVRAEDILVSACDLLGYTDNTGNARLDERIKNIAVSHINMIYSELAHITETLPFIPIKTLNDQVRLPSRAIYEVMPTGIAMLIATSENAGDQEQFWASIYNDKKLLLTRKDKIKDTIPTIIY